MSQKIVPDTITRWLRTLDDNGDKLLLRRAHIDLCDGDHLAATIFSQLLYYHLPDQKGRGTRLRVQKDGHYWVAKKYNDWYEECRINEFTARNKIGQLKKTGLIRTDNFRFNGLKILHLRIDFECMAARVAALDQASGIRSGKSDRERSSQPDRSGNTGRTDPIPQPEPLTETTTGTPGKEFTPKPSQSEGLSDYSGGKNSSRRNRLQEAREDPASIPVSKLFPSDPNTPLKSALVARQFVRRREGLLGGNAAYILAEGLPHARFEGIEAPEWRSCRTYSELFNPRILRPALQAARMAIQERLEEICSTLNLATDPEPGIQRVMMLDRLISEESDLLRFCRYRDDLPACCISAHRLIRPELKAMHSEFADEIKDGLTHEHYWSQIANENSEEIFGIGTDTINKLQADWLRPLQEERVKLEKLLS